MDRQLVAMDAEDTAVVPAVEEPRASGEGQEWISHGQPGGVNGVMLHAQTLALRQGDTINVANISQGVDAQGLDRWRILMESQMENAVGGIRVDVGRELEGWRNQLLQGADAERVALRGELMRELEAQRTELNRVQAFVGQLEANAQTDRDAARNAHRWEFRQRSEAHMTTRHQVEEMEHHLLAQIEELRVGMQAAGQAVRTAELAWDAANSGRERAENELQARLGAAEQAGDETRRRLEEMQACIAEFGERQQKVDVADQRPRSEAARIGENETRSAATAQIGGHPQGEPSPRPTDPSAGTSFGQAFEFWRAADGEGRGGTIPREQQDMPRCGSQTARSAQHHSSPMYCGTTVLGAGTVMVPLHTGESEMQPVRPVLHTGQSVAHTVEPTSHTEEDVAHTVELSGCNVEHSEAMTNPMAGFSAPMTDACAVNGMVGVESTATSGCRPQLPPQNNSTASGLPRFSTKPHMHSTLPFVHSIGGHGPDPYASLGSYASVGGSGGIGGGVSGLFRGPEHGPDRVPSGFNGLNGGPRDGSGGSGGNLGGPSNPGGSGGFPGGFPGGPSGPGGPGGPGGPSGPGGPGGGASDGQTFDLSRIRIQAPERFTGARDQSPTEWILSMARWLRGGGNRSRDGCQLWLHICQEQQDLG